MPLSPSYTNAEMEKTLDSHRKELNRLEDPLYTVLDLIIKVCM